MVNVLLEYIGIDLLPIVIMLCYIFDNIDGTLNQSLKYMQLIVTMIYP